MALTGLKKIGMITQEDPVLKREGDVLLRVSHVGVCGSDMHQYNTGCIGGTPVEYPFVLGHEGSGFVVEPGTAAGSLEHGQRVMIEPAMPCGECDQCLSGRSHTCRKMKFLGSPGQSPGLLCENIIMPARCCLPLPEKLDNRHAVLAEPLSIAIWAVDLSGAQRGLKVGILGSGPVGISVLLYCRYLGVEEIYMTDLLDYRLGMAGESGAWWTGNPEGSDVVSGILGKSPEGLDVIFDCCGKQEAMDQAVELIKPGGKIMIVGIPEFGQWKLSTDLTRRKEVGFQNVRRQNNRLHRALELMSEGHVDASHLITHNFAFEDAGRAFDLVSGYGDSVMKAIIEI